METLNRVLKYDCYTQGADGNLGTSGGSFSWLPSASHSPCHASAKENRQPPTLLAQVAAFSKINLTGVALIQRPICPHHCLDGGKRIS